MGYDSKLPEGIITATLTPMNAGKDVDIDRLVMHIKWLFDRGSDGVCLLGTTGEASSLTVSERIEVINHVIDAGIEPAKLLVGTTCCALPDTIELSRLATARGVGGVLIMPPFYYKNLKEEGVLETYRTIIDGVDHPDLRVYIYHFPKMSGFSFSPELVVKLTEKHPGTIVGLKDSGGDWPHMQSILELLPGFRLYAGSEKFLLPTLQAGGAGCISASANLTAPLCTRLLQSWQSEQAGAIQEKVSRARAGLEIAPFVSGLKSLFAHYQDDPSWLNIRPPNSIPEGEVVDQLLAHMAQLDPVLSDI